MNDLIIRKEKVDWLKIIDMAFNRQDWGKSYVLYTCNTATISCMMKEFNFEDQVAWFRITVSYIHNECKESTNDIIRYALENFTIDDFKMHLNKKLTNMLNDTIVMETRNIAKVQYNELRTHMYDIEEEHFLESDYSDDYKIIMKIENESLQEECLDELRYILDEELNKEFNSKVDNYIEHNRMDIKGVTDLYNLMKEEEK